MIDATQKIALLTEMIQLRFGRRCWTRRSLTPFPLAILRQVSPHRVLILSPDQPFGSEMETPVSAIKLLVVEDDIASLELVTEVFTSLKAEVGVGSARMMRLQPIDTAHPGVVALLCGPLVLFPIIDNGSPLLWSSAQLLAATKTEDQLWEAGAATGPVKFRA
jgi:hypothetical protein